VIACVLRSGGVYRPEHVQRLADQAAKFAPGVPFVCLSDVAVPVSRVPLKHDWPGWWSKLELFRPGVFPHGERVFYADLDTTFAGRLGSLLERPEPFLALANFYVREGRQSVGGNLGSGLMQWTSGEMTHLYDRFAANPDAIMSDCGAYGDQLFIHNEAGERAYWQDVVPDAVVSYKVHCAKGVPESAKVVCYHGRPRPWEVEA
jgi:hypothetical protein